MNTDVLQEFLVRLGFAIDQEGLNRFIGSLSESAIRVGAFGAAMVAAAGVVIHSVKEIAEENKQLALLADQMKTTAGAIDDFIDTADMMGISNETATNTLKDFSGKVADSAMGIGRAKLVFEKLGIAVKDSNGNMRSATDVMADVQDKLKGMDRASQLRIMERLGIDPKFLVIFNDQLGRTSKIGDELSKIDIATGFNLDTSIKESKEFTNSWKGMTIEINLLRMTFSKMYEAVAIKIMPSIRKGVEQFGKVIEDVRHIIMDNAKQIEDAFQPVIEIVLRVGLTFTKLIATAMKIVSSVVSPLINGFIELNKATNGWIVIIGSALLAWKMFNLGFLATPLGAIVALGVAVLALVDDFQTFQEGGSSFFDWSTMVNTISIGIEMFKNGLNGIKNLFSGVINLALSLVDLFSGNFSGFWDKWKESGQDFLNFFKGVIDQFKLMFDMAKSLKAPLSEVGNTVSGWFNSKPSPASSGGNVSQNTVINVNGAQSPVQTAQLVKSQQSDVNNQITRNMNSRIR